MLKIQLWHELNSLLKVTVNVCDTKFGVCSLKAERYMESRYTIHHSIRKNSAMTFWDYEK